MRPYKSLLVCVYLKIATRQYVELAFNETCEFESWEYILSVRFLFVILRLEGKEPIGTYLFYRHGRKRD